MSKGLSHCSLHGVGVYPAYLVGRRLERVLAAWHQYGIEAPASPLEVWLVDDHGACTHITTGSDWCLIVDGVAPHEGYEMGGDGGRVEVVPIVGETPFAAYLGETVVAVREGFEADTGRIELEITFPAGSVRCGSWVGDLRLTS